MVSINTACSHRLSPPRHSLILSPTSCRSAVKQPTSHRPRIMLAGRPGAGQTSHLAPAILHALERFTVHSLDSAVLFGVSSTSPEEACAQVTPPDMCIYRWTRMCTQT